MFIGLLCIMFSIESTGQTNQLKRASDVATLKKQLRTDSSLRFEYACAKEFHIYLNAYRSSRKLKPLRWNDTLWVVAMNHGYYLHENKLFSHTELPENTLFSGSSPGNRYDYVLESMYYTPACGENLFSTSAYENSPEQNAKYAFNAWKSSIGHNRNMLLESYDEHGTAAVIGPSGLIFIDVFSMGVLNLSAKRNPPTSATMTAEAYDKKSVPADQGLTSSAFKKLLGKENWISFLVQNLPKNAKQNKHLNAACAKSSQAYLDESTRDKNIREKLKKGEEIYVTESKSYQPKWYQAILGKTKLQESILYIAIRTNAVDLNKIKTQVESMSKSHLEKVANSMKKFGFHLNWKKRGKHFLICASLQSS